MFIQDDYCRDNNILNTLKNEQLWRDAEGSFNWWDGWEKTPPKNIWEQVIQGIWKNHPIVDNIAGFEYWVNVLDSNSADTNHLGWHLDKDETLKEQTGKTVCPVIGTVYYGYPHQLSGGFLEISLEPTFTDVERIQPRYNRLVILDVSQQHRVSRIYSGSRFGLQINLWKEKPLSVS